MEYLQRYSSFSVRNGTAEISLPFAKLSSFQSLVSRKQLREIEVQMVSAISFGWFADFGKTLTIIEDFTVADAILLSGANAAKFTVNV